MKIEKILVANRGEIACRVIKTAKKMNIKTVAVYSDADRNSLHRRSADEAVHIGPSPAADSYLVIEKIIDACIKTGADAVHPGYGFLSENPEFVRACNKAGVIFLGPSSQSMEKMGLKDAAKKLMNGANVPITPGYHSDDQNGDILQNEADKIGYPVLIKAVAGGGGKGMRKVDSPDQFPSALTSCKREAKSSFGDDRVLIEKYISSPRHIEVQIFGDTHGNVVHMFERDCSLQRRHQKVIEEAPAPGMTPPMREAMTQAAIQAARAVSYVGAGTVEFIVDGSGPLHRDGFWFMEMNTRLQVEHPVSEMITGLDLVEWQIRVAQGEKLPSQDQIELNGHAIEARLYAEDPANDFLPSVGSLDILKLPQTHRVDTGVEQGSEVSIYYDPMISKIIVHCEDRQSAIKELAHLCRSTQVYPVKSNARFLANCLEQRAFASGNFSTDFIAQNAANLFGQNPLEADKNCLALAMSPIAGNLPFGAKDGWRLNQPRSTTFTRTFEGKDIIFALEPEPENSNRQYQRYHRPQGDIIFVDGLSYLIENGSGVSGETDGGNLVTAPMPGKIIAVHVSKGGNIQVGDPVIVMEAMKMEMTLEAPRSGIVGDINTSADTLVAQGDVLVTLEE